MGYKEELNVVQNETREALEAVRDTFRNIELKGLDDRESLACKKVWRSYNEKLKALKEKYNITD